MLPIYRSVTLSSQPQEGASAPPFKLHAVSETAPRDQPPRGILSVALMPSHPNQEIEFTIQYRGRARPPPAE
eukprot:3359211-Prymnesium_polylepis.1